MLFSWLVGNSDMHLKNFSLYRPQRAAGYQLTPAYDLLSTKLVLPGDTEELALTLCGKKSKLGKEHFTRAMKDSGIPDKVIENSFSKFTQVADQWYDFIQESTLPDDMKESFIALIAKNISAI